MLSLLLLIGVGFAVSAAFSEEDEGTLELVDEDTDIVVSEDFQDDVAAVLTPEELAFVDFVPGPIDVDTGAGPDFVIGSNGADEISAGSGDDLVFGGAGDDVIELGSGDDGSGIAPEATPPTTQPDGSIFDFGNDVINGQGGNDQIADAFGSNQLIGGSGNDTLLAVDQDVFGGPTPDAVFGGTGDDYILVDRGDEVSTGDGSDTVVVDASRFEDGGPLIGSVEITDFEQSEDMLVIRGAAEDVEMRPGEVVPPITIVPSADSTSATVFLRGEPVAVVVGGAGLSLSDIVIETS